MIGSQCLRATAAGEIFFLIILISVTVPAPKFIGCTKTPIFFYHNDINGQ
jgi:hypothetical protein